MMQFTFINRQEENYSEWDRINKKLLDDLHTLAAGQTDEAEATAYITAMIDELRPVENRLHKPMLFLMYNDPASMGADDRVDYLYRPTYIAAALMMTAVCRYPALMRKAGYCRTLMEVLNATTARDFLGAWYDDYPGLLDTLQIFATGDIVRFMEEYRWVNEYFVEKLRSALTFVETELCTGKVKGGWNGAVDYRERGAQVLAMYSGNDEGSGMA